MTKRKARKLTKRARRKEMTGINLAAIKRRLEHLEAIIQELEINYEGLGEWMADLDNAVMPHALKPKGAKKK